MRYKAVNLRLDPDMMAILDGLVERDKAKIEAIGLDAEANYSTVLRRLIKAEAKNSKPPVDTRQLEIPTPAPTPKATKKRSK